MMVPGLAGVWDRGVSIRSAAARTNLTQSIRAAEMIGAAVLLVAFFGDNAPDITDEASFAPIVDLLKDVARPAADAGVILGLENSLSPAENARLTDQPRRKRGEDDSLWTEQSYRDFILRADWRLTAEPVLQQMNVSRRTVSLRWTPAGKRILHPVQHADDSGILLRGDAKAQVNIWSQPMGSGDINPIHKDATLATEIRRTAMPRVRADRPAGSIPRTTLSPMAMGRRRRRLEAP